MAAFATTKAAEIRAYAKRLDKTWINAHMCRIKNGTIAVRVQRPASHTHPEYGGWVELTQDNQT